MLNSAIIEVAVGLIFIYSLLSILATQVNNLILNALNLRGKQLKEGLLTLVNDKDLQAKILAHPLIKMVDQHVKPTQDLTDAEAEAIINSKETQVTYIPPETFVEALVSLLTAEADSSIYKPLRDAIDALPNTSDKVRLRELLRDLRSFTDVSTRRIREIILELQETTDMQKQILSYALEQVEENLGRLPVKSGQLMPLLEGIRKLDPESPFKSAIETVLVTAQSLEDARAKLQGWFNDGMDRIADLYRRKLQIISLIVGALLAVVLNVDTLHLARALWENPETRRAVVSAAAQQNLQTLPSEALTTPPPDQGGETGETGAATTQDVEVSVSQVQATVQSLLNLQLPIGWELIPVDETLVETSQAVGLPNPKENLRNLWNLLPGNNPDGWLGLLIQKFIGLLVTAIAVAQGAPFWFDLLRRLTGGSSTPPPSPTVNVNLDVERKAGGLG